jgi:predicted esterase YcpF (UPF0227 family)
MKLVIYPPRFRDFDGRKLVVRTINKLRQDEHLLILKQSLDLALDEQELHCCYYSASSYASSYAQCHTLLAVEKFGTRET